MSNDKKKVLVIILSILIVLGAMGTYTILSIQNKNDGAHLNIITEIDYSNEEIEKLLNEEVAESMINIQYSLYATFDGRDSSDFFVRNIKNNHYPIVFTLYDEDDELIYESDKIDLGYEFKGLSLEKELGRGEHKGTIQIGYVAEGNVSSAFPIYLTVK